MTASAERRLGGPAPVAARCWHAHHAMHALRSPSAIPAPSGSQHPMHPAPLPFAASRAGGRDETIHHRPAATMHMPHAPDRTHRGAARCTVYLLTKTTRLLTTPRRDNPDAWSERNFGIIYNSKIRSNTTLTTATGGAPPRANTTVRGDASCPTRLRDSELN